VTRSGQEYDGDEEARENNNQTKTAQQMAPEQHSNSSQTTLNFLPEQQPKGTVDPEDHIDSFNKSVEIRNDSIISHHHRLQQSEYIRNPEDLQNDPTTDNSDSAIVFPWRMAGKFDSIEPEDIFLVYPSNNGENNTNAWNTNMTDAGSLSSNMAELRLFESEDDNHEYFIETPIPSSTEEKFAEAVDMPEKEYLVASSSEYKGVRIRNEMQADIEDNDERDVDDDDDEVNGGQIESPIHELHTLTDVIQNKRPNIPKRSFVSENLKMRISQLATGERRRNPAADEVRSEETRYLTGPKSGQKQPAPRTEAVTNRPRGSSPLLAKTRTLNRNTRPEANKIMPDTSVDRTTVRSQPLQRLPSNAKPSTRVPPDRRIASRASKSQNNFSRQLNRNHTHRTMSDLEALQLQAGLLRQGSVDYQVQGSEYEMTFPRHRQIHLNRNSEAVPEMANEGQRTANTNLFTTGGHPTMNNSVIHATDKGIGGIQRSKSGQNEVVEHKGRPVVRRKAMETPHRTFGTRTRTRGREFSFQRRPTHVQTTAEASTDAGAPKFCHSQQTGQDVSEIRPSESGAAGVTTMTSLGMDTRGSLISEIPMEVLINIVGPIPKGFTDPATIQNLDSFNHMGPLFHLPLPIQPEPFRNQIPNSVVPLVSTAVTPSTNETLPSFGVTNFNQDVNVFQPYTQTFQQHYTSRHSETHSPQKFIQTITATSNLPNAANVSRHEWQLHEKKQLVSDQRSSFSPSQVQSSMTASTSSLPSMRKLAEFIEPLLLHFPPPNDHLKAMLIHTAIATVHSSPDDETIKAKIVRLPQTSSFQKLLSFSDQQLNQPGHQKENLVILRTHESQPPAEDRPVPLLDAARHAAQSEYTKKLQEYFQQLQSYYRQQHHQ
jgi:hypothetical protein